MGGHAGEPHGRLLGQVGAAAAVVRAGGMGVGAAGPRVAAVDAVQAAVGDKQSGGGARSGGGGERKGQKEEPMECRPHSASEKQRTGGRVVKRQAVQLANTRFFFSPYVNKEE